MGSVKYEQLHEHLEIIPLALTITWGVFDGILSMSLGTGSWNKRLDGLLSTDITISTIAVFPPVKKLLQVIKLPFPFLAVFRKYMIYECPSSDLSY